MSKLLDIWDVCAQLGIKRTSFYKYLPALVADGLKEIRSVGQRKRVFTEESVEALRQESIRTGKKIGELQRSRRGPKRSEQHKN